jgi:hypothetical protein
MIMLAGREDLQLNVGSKQGIDSEDVDRGELASSEHEIFCKEGTINFHILSICLLRLN